MKHRILCWKTAEGLWNWHVVSRGRVICQDTQGYTRKAAMIKIAARLFNLNSVAQLALSAVDEARF